LDLLPTRLENMHTAASCASR